MISNYEIKTVNNEEVLYLYFDFDNEFGKLKGKTKKKKLKEEINDYIKNNNIKFRGKKVAIIAGGLLIGTLVLNKPIQTYDTNFTTNKIVSIMSPKEIVEDEIQDSDMITSEENINYDNVEKDNEKNQSLKIESNITNSSPKINSNSSSLNNRQNQEQVSKQEENKGEEIHTEENKVFVNVYRQNNNIKIELEEYIVGVVGAEMPASFNIEALKAQAVLARTYALKAIQNNIKLTDSSSTQNYKSNEELKSMWGSNYNTYYNKILSAVNETKGKYLTYNGTLIEAVYHSTSNGTTENAENVWGNSFPYLVSVESKYDDLNPSFIKEQFITYEEISKKLNMNINTDTTFEIISKTSGNRVDIIKINGINYRGVDIRNLLGLRSADFTITKIENGINFQTKGYGHGVGMSQYGANGMAKNGYNYVQILNHYYPGTLING